MTVKETPLQVSAALVDAAVKHVMQHCHNVKWLEQNRQLSREWDYAYWKVPGNNRLLVGEMRAASEKVMEVGWPQARAELVFDKGQTNWEMVLVHRL